MSKSTIFLTAATAILSAMIMAQGASATGTKEAIKLCEKNPNCTLLEVNDKETIMTVKGNKGGKSIVQCPTTGNGQCTAYFQFPPRNGVGGQGGKGSNPKQADGGGGNGSGGGGFQGDGSGAAQAGSASDGNGGGGAIQ